MIDCGKLEAYAIYGIEQGIWDEVAYGESFIEPLDRRHAAEQLYAQMMGWA